MTLLYADGFEDGFGAWQSQSSISNTTGRFGNGMVTTGGNGGAYYPIAATNGPVIFGFAFKTPAAGGTGAICEFRDNVGNTNHVDRLAAGEIAAYRGVGLTNLLGTSAANVLPVSSWVYVEVKMLNNATTGSVVVRVNGAVLITFTGNTQAVQISRLNLGGQVSGIPSGAAFDDVYVCDTTGSYNNDFLGDVHVEHLRPSDDAAVAWIGSDGNSVANYALVNEAGGPVTTTYVGSQTVGAKDLYTVSASSRPPANTVMGVVVSGSVQKTDAGARTMRFVAKEGAAGTDRLGTTIAPGTGFSEFAQVFDRKADGSAWTVADVNNLRIGAEVVS